MKKNVAKKWVKALRSGKYKQSREMLKNSGGYCCLGVLCEILDFKWTVHDRCPDLIPVIRYKIKYSKDGRPCYILPP